MKGFLKYFILPFLLTLNIQSVSSEPVKRALIIAIGDYPDSLGWARISSTNDVPLIKKALEGQDFKEQNIIIITDRNATRTGIVNAINNLIRGSDC